MSLGTIVVEEVNLILKVDDFVETVAIVLTALCTFLAARAAMRSAEISKTQLLASLNNADQVNFFGLLDALEKAHGIRFLTRGALYEELKDLGSYLELYKSKSAAANTAIERVIKFDSEVKSRPGFNGRLGKSPDLFEVYFDYAKEVSLLFQFDFNIPEENDFVVLDPIGIKVPVYDRDPDKVVYIVDAVANEILGYKNSDYHLLGIGVSRRRDVEYFEAFYNEYKDSQSGEYQYVEAKG
ncbi:hypothetical protein [Vibrio vulnificus]|uniref:hypothetical protein n=1 Tax=Vibrio vulnificus TaxID=672 RepID=UPI000929CECB|nr:hypothetical protein [Vibrio vulnificus]EJE8695003.1 hypothetical protein [Vibrio vulnificus]ELS3451607.1 hypothetical protein [Vibrio vulnificus]ELS9101080.1 hypothetical protein [Vibrio vulnificus]MCU8177601.1 hypothetical protein [Vibrio vulnificus]MDK2683885.1 hypothetical protein [Vibrio vulnificus]